MNATRPEASTEYSRGNEASGPDSGAPGRRGSGGLTGPTAPSAHLGLALLLAGLAGAALLVVAEFTPLLTVHTSASRAAFRTVNTGSNHSYALIPIGLLAIFLSYSAWQSQSRLALTAMGVLGVVALLIALLGDLPDAQASGLVGSAATRFTTASSTPSVGLYLETLGAVVLVITAGAGLLLLPGPARRIRARNRD
jgi:hypothetical protein